MRAPRVVSLALLSQSTIACEILAGYSGAEPAPPSSSGTTAAFCARRSDTLCDDFDTGAPSKPWTINDSGGGSVDVVADLWRSSPYSLRTGLPELTGDADSYARIESQFDVAWRKALVELDLFIEQPAWQQTDSNIAILSLQVEGTLFQCHIFLDPLGAFVTVQSSTSEYLRAPTSLPFGAWTHLRWEVTPGSPTAHVELYVNGASAAFIAGNAACSVSSSELASLGLELGLARWNVDRTPVFTLYYDDVTLNVE